MASVTEKIDERILRLLGLEDVFDLDYDTYLNEIRAAMVVGANKLAPEELALLANERKRIRGKKGRFSPKKQKITADKISTTKLLRPSGSKSSALSIGKISKSTGVDGAIVGKDLIEINQRLEGIIKALTEQNKLEKKSAEDKRKNREDEKRRKKEERLEGGLKALKAVAQKVLSPVQGILDKIVKFILFTVLGRAFKLFMDWASDPKNKKKLESIGRFLKDWWPLLLGAWFFFANPLGRFIRTIVGTVLKLTFKIGKFAIPKLLSFIRANPLASLIVGTSVAGTLARTGERERLQPEVQKQRESIEKTQKNPDAPWYQKLGSIFAGQQLSMGQGQATVAPVPGAMYNSGGSVFSGIVDKNSGTTVSGAGPDTQFFPVEGGGGAILQKGESVLQVGARERMIQETGHDPLAYNVGSNANKPRPVRNNVFANAYGGLVGLNGGGIIGQGLQFLGKFLPQTGRVIAPRGSQMGIQNKLLGMNLSREIINQQAGTRLAPGAVQRYNQNPSAPSVIRPWSPYDSTQVSVPKNVSKPKPKSSSGLNLNLQQNVQTIQGAAKRQEEMMRQMGYEPDGYVNLYGQPIKKKLGGLLNSSKYQRGGMIKENSGSDYGPDGNRLEGADRQYFSYFAHPGEARFIFTKTATDRGAVRLAELIQAKLDPNSNAAMKGKYTLPPPSRKRGSNIKVLPPIDTSSGSVGKGGGVPMGTAVPTFSVVSSTSYDNRMKIAKTYGIV